jgi:peptidoglycan/xylan/chitin deacetylase (PgdA/CDA1 family)
MHATTIPRVIVTTSWDDGHVLDRKLADLLLSLRLPATFYIAPQNGEWDKSQCLTNRDLQVLARDFEIGGHTLNHVRLRSVPEAVARREITEGKDALEQVIGTRLRSFCYPGGSYGSQHPPMVEEAGFVMARTVRRGVTCVPEHPFETHTSVHAYRHLVDGPATLRVAHGNPKRAARMYRSWDDFAVGLFDKVVATGGVFHIWGHSWEIDRRGEWSRLQRVLRHVSDRADVVYVSNGDLSAVAR